MNNRVVVAGELSHRKHIKHLLSEMEGVEVLERGENIFYRSTPIMIKASKHFEVDELRGKFSL